jgi:hypothetical protein
VAAIAQLATADEDTVREVIHLVSADGLATVLTGPADGR